MKAVFRADASAEIGGGHMMRCLALASKLRAAGADLLFVVNPEASTTSPALLKAGHPVEIVAAGSPVGLEALRRHWPGGADLAVVDHYGFAEAEEKVLRRAARAVAVIDDLADRRHDCDLLIDTGGERKDADYRGSVPEACRLLLGPAYAMLRDEFAWARPLALERRGGTAKRALVSMGLTDPHGISGKIVRELVRAAPGLAIDCVLAGQSPSHAMIAGLVKSGADIACHIDPPSMAALMVEADIAVGAAGTTVWERCCLGLPGVVVGIAGNQRANAAMLDARGAAAVAGADPEEIAAAVSGLLRDDRKRQAMSANAAAICDGQGAAKVVDAILALAGGTGDGRSGEIAVRPADERDALAVWCWRFDPAARAASLDPDTLAPWAQHRGWFLKRLRDSSAQFLIGEKRGDPCGYARFDGDPEGSSWRVSIAVSPLMKGQGIGKRLLGAAIDDFRGRAGVKRLHAEIRAENQASLRIFKAAGFAVDRKADGVVYVARN
jgi:UDP-2,4-diacetamido-2,4,6-trideoxy-beta-L-altropyranose hydrolase